MRLMTEYWKIPISKTLVEKEKQSEKWQGNKEISTWDTIEIKGENRFTEIELSVKIVTEDR